jgi:hypothetical protein
VTDNDGGAANRSVSVVIAVKPPVVAEYAAYGAGWIGTHRDKVSFAFAGKNYRGVPLGSAELRQHDNRHDGRRDRGLSFRASSVSSVEVGKRDIRIEGSGRLNDRRGYSFLLTARAGDRGETFRMKIWDSSTGKVVYDSQPGDADDAEPSSRVNGGNIAVVRIR